MKAQLMASTMLALSPVIFAMADPDERLIALRAEVEELTTERDGSVLAARGLHGIVVQSSEECRCLRRGDLQGFVQLGAPLARIRHGEGCYGLVLPAGAAS